MELIKPDIFQYLDYRLYMKDNYQFLKSTLPHFSFAVWNQKSQFKSRSYLRLVMMGQRELTTQTIPKVASALELTKTQYKYFETLVQMNQAKTIPEREFLLSKIIHSAKSYQPTKVKNSYEYLSSYQTPRILSAIFLKDIECNSKTLSKYFKMDEKRVVEILKTLEKLELIYEENGRWKTLHKFVKVDDELGNIALQTFHNNLLEEAKKAILLPPKERDFRSITLSLDEEKYQQYLEDIRNFSKQILGKYQNQKGNAHRIYHLNFQCIPVSEKLISSEVDSKLEQNLDPVCNVINTQTIEEPAQELPLTDNKKIEAIL